MKFGKQIQKKQLEIPEYASHFVDYKGLKKLIKELKSSPVSRPNDLVPPSALVDDPQSNLQANKAPFFFRLDRELDKVNTFYTIKESESRVRLRVLIDKQKSMRLRNPIISKTSTQYITLEQGFRDFINDLNKLQQFIEINATAFSKILKKWDKTSKSQTKELYLSRAVEVQPCFNHDIISDLSDQASTSLLDCAAWAEGDGTLYNSVAPDQQAFQTPRLEQDETDSDLIEALNAGDVNATQYFVQHLENGPNSTDRITKAFITTISQANEAALTVLLDTKRVDFSRKDEINDRNCLHKAAMTGRLQFVKIGLEAGVDASSVDAYGRIPLHYACMNGHVELIPHLIEARPQTTDFQDLDNFSALIHSIVHGHFACVQQVLSFSARVDPLGESDHIPLNLACQYGSLAIVKLLLQGKPQINPDAEGLYPQHLVARFGRDPQLFLLLREYGADLDQPDKLYQWTPIFHAGSEGRLECLRMLLQCGVKPGAVDEKGLSALYYATWEGHMECMNILADAMISSNSTMDRRQMTSSVTRNNSQPSRSISTSGDVEIIPDLALPPPIIPTRRYGHNFLQAKTTVVITFDDPGRVSVVFYDETKYPAARLTVAPRSSDILPRNILLPMQDDNRSVSFETENLETFAIDFDVYPTFGKKVIAKGSVPAEVFRSRQCSSGSHYLSLLDPRLRSVGQICFTFNVIKPFSGIPLEITHHATYWKATSQLDSRPNSFITGSSLSGYYVRLYVQLSRDHIPVLHREWMIDHAGLQQPIIGLTFHQFSTLGASITGKDRETVSFPGHIDDAALSAVHERLANSYCSLGEALDALPRHVKLELHVLYPTEEEEYTLRLGPTANTNDFVDSLLKVVFEHVRQIPGHVQKEGRSIVFSSSNKDLCTALNWKQPNFPVLLCNSLGTTTGSRLGSNAQNVSTPKALSVKEAVRIAQNNNFMGLVCSSTLLNTVPDLIESIKVAGLVLVSDASEVTAANTKNTAQPLSSLIPEGVDGLLRKHGVLQFTETVDT